MISSPVDRLINLPHGGIGANFGINELVHYFKVKKLAYIIIGNSHLSYANHKKTHSLDVWLRNHKTVNSRDTCKAVNIVINEIVSTGLFRIKKCKCPITMCFCRALVLIN
jgi:hypothetical protein